MKKYLISKTTTYAEVFKIKAKDENEAIEMLKMLGTKHFKKVNDFTTDIFYQSEGEAEN
jgi:hypothetical protein